MPTIFARIAAGEVPAYRVAETAHYLAFLDINPLTEGHTLCIPKQEQDYLFDLETDDYVGLFIFAREVAKAIGKSVECRRVGLAVVGFEVAHAHIHLVPMNDTSDLDFNRQRLALTEAQFDQLAAKIRSHIG
jgi:histidine triad (HIT) family protein